MRNRSQRDKRRMDTNAGNVQKNDVSREKLSSRQQVHTDIQRDRNFVKSLNGEIIARLFALNLTDKVMRKSDHLRQLRGSQAFFLPVFSDIAPYCVIYRIMPGMLPHGYHRVDYTQSHGVCMLGVASHFPCFLA